MPEIVSKRPIKNPPQGRRWWFYGNAAEELTTDGRSLGVSSVLACVNVLSESLASLPLNIYRKNGDRREEITDIPLFPVLNGDPNPSQTTYEVIQHLIVDAILYGSGYAQVVTDDTGQTLGLYPLNARMVSVARIRSANGFAGLKKSDIGLLFYFYGDYVLPERHVLRVNSFCHEGITGKSLLDIASNSVGSAMAAENYSGRWFANIDSPSGFLQFPKELSDEEYERFLARWTQDYAGKENVGSVAILENATFNPVTVDHAKSQLLETRQFSRSEIAGILRVPLHLIGDLANSSYNNIQSLDQDFVKHTLRPWATRIEQSMQKRLLSQSQKVDHIIRFDFSDLLRGDQQSRYTSYATGISSGIISPNEARLSEHMDPFEGGDTHFLNSANKPVQQLEMGQETSNGN